MVDIQLEAVDSRPVVVDIHRMAVEEEDTERYFLREEDSHTLEAVPCFLHNEETASGSLVILPRYEKQIYSPTSSK